MRGRPVAGRNCVDDLFVMIAMHPGELFHADSAIGAVPFHLPNRSASGAREMTQECNQERVARDLRDRRHPHARIPRVLVRHVRWRRADAAGRCPLAHAASRKPLRPVVKVGGGRPSGPLVLSPRVVGYPSADDPEALGPERSPDRHSARSLRASRGRRAPYEASHDCIRRDPSHPLWR